MSVILNEGKKITHNWVAETMGECAKVHMDQLLDAYFNYVKSPKIDQRIKNIMESYHRIEVSVLNGENFIIVPKT